MSPASICSIQRRADQFVRPSGRFRTVNIADRAYFKAFKSGVAATPVLIELVQSRFTGGWTTVIARKMTGPNGEFSGGRHKSDHARQLRKILRIGGARRRRGDFDVPSRRNAAGALSACRDDDRAEFHERSGPSAGLVDKSDHGTTAADQSDGRPGPAGFGPRLDGLSHRRSSRPRLSRRRWPTGGNKPAFWSSWPALRARDRRPAVLVGRKTARSSTQLEKQRLDTAVNNMTQGLLVFDSSARVTVCNQRYIDMYRVVAGGGETRLHHAGSDRASEGHRILRGRRRGILRRDHLRNVALGKVT